METIYVQRRTMKAVWEMPLVQKFIRCVLYSRAAVISVLHALFCRMCAIREPGLAMTFVPYSEKGRAYIGKQRMLHEFFKARQRVPAYVKLPMPMFKSLSTTVAIKLLPVLDKNHFAKSNTIESCCIHGFIPKGSVIDESSGSSGAPMQWVRGKREREYNQRLIRFSLKRLIPGNRQIIINAFALGPWATGMNISSAFEKHAVLKSLGPDASKIIQAIKHFGTAYSYIIMGYPPFLKNLTDRSDIRWSEYNVSFIYGGESMSEYLREYMQRKCIRKVYGSYGASDLELNIAAENDFTIEIRKLLMTNKLLANKLLMDTNILPMVFQYNPADFYIEQNSNNELLFTLCRPGYVVPKIRYNIYDKGHTLRLKDLKRIMRSCGIDTSEFQWPKIDLPLLFLYGRSDASVSYYGCKICPQHVQDCIMMSKTLRDQINNFCMHTRENNVGDKQLEFYMELKSHGMPDILKTQDLAALFLLNLEQINQDFRESMAIAGRDNIPLVHFFPAGHHQFRSLDFKVKYQYII
ncbi:MAG: hypothetical protein JST26_11490 [Bacteroidetes bacterium]|nr:hypothetical protein [Bacteroidota bacterium]